ncbi:MAG: alpha/beta hydrolase [Burkholderiales bacterium]|nr:alpha/beta hydrolase [Burkholderiales bacterium]
MLDEIKPTVQDSVHVQGRDIYYEYFGERQCPVMVILNGVAMETKSWYRLLSNVLPVMDVLLWDYRGQGQSTSDDAPYSVEETADHLVAILDALELDKRHVNLLGVSTGSIVVAETLRRYRNRVNRAVLSGVVLERALTFKLDSDYGIRLLRENRADLWAEGLYTKILSDRYMTEFAPVIPAMQSALIMRYKNKTHALARIIEAQSNYLWNIEQYRPQFEEVDTPMLVLAGAEDKLIPPFYQKRAAAMFPRADIKQYSDCAHIPFIENPARAFRDSMRFFLTN